MNIVCISIGNELLNGEITDTNKRWLGRALHEAGYTLTEAITIGDDSARIRATIEYYIAGGYAIIATGGLGPTGDDITARAVAQAFRLRLVLNDEALVMVRGFFQRMGNPCPPGNEKQALLPQKAQVLENSCGTAPGFFLRHNDIPAFFLPGVPLEMQTMFARQVLPRLRTSVPAQENIPSKTLYTFGISEAELEQRLSRLHFKDQIQLRYRLDGPQVLVRIEALSGGIDALNSAGALIKHELGLFLLGEEPATLPEATASALCHSGLCLALAESCTGGLIAKLLTDQSGSSAFLERSAVTYANSAKRDMLGVSMQVLMQHGAVSRECAAAMASGIRQRAKTDIALAVTGVAGPNGGSAEKPVGTVFIALATAKGTEVRDFTFSGDRAAVRKYTAYAALDWIRRVALQQAPVSRIQ
ncbi:MAG: CinA family nicotinamide mononucleotide deamidase-related protein [Desulfuromonadaceae bacterium]|nr:CinA family nicotinamide mononucleotide deamidase-related protein [Desulfuromonadaceae bacterium]